MRRIEMPSEQLAMELQEHLKENKFTPTSYDKGRRAIQFPDDMDPALWSGLKDAVNGWAEERSLDVVESLRLQPKKSGPVPEKQEDRTKIETEVSKKLEDLPADKAEARYDYLSSKSITELTDAELEERLRLVQRTFAKPKDQKK